MSRHDYPLTEETRKVIATNYKTIADEMGVDPRYIYGIVYGENPDAYSFFRVWYASCVRAEDVSHCIYDDDMASIRNRYRKQCPIDSKEYILNKIHTDAETTKTAIQAFSDGKLDKPERLQLRADLEKIRANCDWLEAVINLNSGTD